MVHMQVNIWMG